MTTKVLTITLPIMLKVAKKEKVPAIVNNEKDNDYDDDGNKR